MAVTLEQAKLDVQDALQMGVIDEFRKSSFLLDNLTFDDCVSPTGGGATLTYGYTRLITQPTAAFRAVNTEYVPQEVTKQRYTVDLKVFGGSFQIDRVISNMGGIVDEVSLQMSQKIKAAKSLFHNTVINGNSTADENAFDGLDVALTGSDTEWNTGTSKIIDFTTTVNIEANAGKFLLLLNKALKKLDGKPTAIMGNGDMISVLEYIAKVTGKYQETKDEWGTNVSTYNWIPLIDLGAKCGSNDDVVKTETLGSYAGCTSIYIARFALDGFHAISMAGVPPVQSWLPDFTTAGSLKTGEVEMVAAVALKATKAAGVFRGLKVVPTAG
ncbi:hypothetical protein FACS1894198_6340 [Clostridia bacterium]|nr:hypothetical protein FACS1894198_6340 [Clostridia bacterium]